MVGRQRKNGERKYLALVFSHQMPARQHTVASRAVPRVYEETVRGMPHLDSSSLILATGEPRAGAPYQVNGDLCSTTRMHVITFLAFLLSFLPRKKKKPSVLIDFVCSVL